MLRLRPRLLLLAVTASVGFFCVLLFVTPNPLSTRDRVVGAVILIAVAGPLSYARARNL